MIFGYNPLTDITYQAKIAKIVEQTFDKRPMPSGNITIKEVRRRTHIAKELFNALYYESKWSAQRIEDHLLRFMIMIIDGDDIPDCALEVCTDKSTMWGVEAAKRVESESRLSALSNKPLVVIPGGKNGN